MKKLMLAIIALMFMVGVNAQTAIQTPKVLDNTYIGINGGATTPLSFNSMFPVNGTFGLRVGKDFTPIFGMNIDGTTWFGSNKDPQTRFDTTVYGHNAFRAINVGLNGTINLTNLFLGYKGTPRAFELSTITGLGWLHTFNANIKDYNDLSAKTGLDFAFNVKKYSQIYVEPAIYWNLTGNRDNAIQFSNSHAQLALSVGYVYKFMTSNGTHNFKLYDIGAFNDRINTLREQLAKKPAVETVVETKEVYVNNPTDVVFFAQNSADLTDDAIVVLNNIKNCPIEVYGYASPEGSEKYNQDLSYRRAKAVADYLANEGFPIKKCVGFGSTGDTSNRVVIIKK
jgi:hypothetical protein